MALVLLVAACGDDRAAEGPASTQGPPPTLAELPSGPEAFALEPERLRALYEEAREQGAAHEASAEGLRWSMAAADLARTLALRTDEEDRWLDRARAHLRTASRRKALEGACEAALALARLEAADAGDLQAAYAVAYRTARRFAEGRREQAGCLAEARRLTEVLRDHRPGPEVLAAIDADPDADDPTAHLLAEEEGRAVADWARGREDLGGARLERVEVFGALARGVDRPEMVRVVLYFDRVALFEEGQLAATGDLPRRVFLDFDSTSLGADARRHVPVGAAGVERARIAPFEPGAVRVVFDLDGDATHRLFFLTDPYRVVVDFERGGPVAAVVSAEEGRRLGILVLDPGHGGNELGARHGGLRESHLTLDLSQRVAAILERRLPQTRILLTRERDEAISLEQRVAFANAVNADAFVSIHLNAADDPVEHGGVVTYVLDHTNDRQAIRLAARENGTSTSEVSGLQRILAGLHRDEQVAESRALARLVQIGTLAGGRRVLPRLPDRGVKAGMFYVLVGARMPAILLEASFLTQAEENRALATTRYRQALAEGIAEGIVRWARGE